MKHLLIMLAPIILAAETPKASEIYFSIFDAYKKVTPLSYTAAVTGDIIDKQVGTIPKSQLTARTKAVLTLSVKQGFRPKLVLTGVTSFYETMFSRFIPHLVFLGPFSVLGEYREYKKFITRYAISSVDDAADAWRLTVRDLKEDDGYAHLFVDRSSLLVVRGEYMAGKKLLMRAVIGYTNIGGFTFVERVDYSGEGEKPFSSSVLFSAHTPAAIKDDFFK